MDLKGWVLNAEEGVEIHLEGEERHAAIFPEEMKSQPPQAAAIAEVYALNPRKPRASREFTIRESAASAAHRSNFA